MHYGGKGHDGEGIIREALRRELEEVPPAPPPEQAWARIQWGLAHAQKGSGALRLRLFPWRRLAAAAALLLLFAGLGLALSRSGLPGLLHMSKSAPPQSDLTAEESRASLPEVGPMLQPPGLGGGFILEGRRGADLIEGELPDPAALYRRGQDRVLWMGRSTPTADLRAFVAELGGLLDETVVISDGATVYGCGKAPLEFTAGGRPGVAWRDEDGLHVLLALSGSPDLKALIPRDEVGEKMLFPSGQ